MMKMQDVLFEDRMCMGVMPMYDKAVGISAYVVDEGNVVEETAPHRVLVPLREFTGDIDKTTLALVKRAAEPNGSIEYSGSFLPIRSYFALLDLPLGIVVKNPASKIDVPSNVKIAEHEDVEVDRFYCLTRAELLGVRPRVPGMIASGVQCPDRLGFLIFNPKGILTVMLERPPRVVRIPNHS
jgi:hypothetical protein